ncbi:MAG TPA: isocitrate lyase/phosphoenolpyruvate mutase family protein [Chitinophaga sp.]|uniref:isocitrate lyase/PEP mutase family protein n=1 Tax=Chitinophaga sp. TaxID=1869181 RepID=UPI002C954CC3|nr:isocitrate lyase/phosphoenolpyruvate mutase family protein [Chitinophaga sp.]HVI45298.1 isocitrate lyase/phosphoenolpyruvate mutase family protein [Chitinophaga sp.]
MSSKFQQFKTLHEEQELFALPNAWDAASARTFQEKGFQAIGTSSAAVAGSLGFDDGEKMSFNDYLFVINRIHSVIQVPLTVDIETGYGTSNDEIYNNIQQLVSLGVSGINIEDSVINGASRQLQDAGIFAERLRYIRGRLEADKLELFINIRCDTYLLNIADKQAETQRRIEIYNNTGADGLFLPCIRLEEDILAAARSTKLSLNVMCIPGLPDFPTLYNLGVKRASMGPFMFSSIYGHVGKASEAIIANKNFSAIL